MLNNLIPAFSESQIGKSPARRINQLANKLLNCNQLNKLEEELFEFREAAAREREQNN